MRRMTLNMARSPFVNRITIPAILIALFGSALLLAAFNAGSFLVLGKTYRHEKKILKTQEATLADLNRDIARKKKALAASGAARYSEETLFLSQVLASKHFSWLHFLRDLEHVKPYGVMFASVSPGFSKDGTIRVSIKGVGNPRNELLKLENNMYSDPAFRAVELANEQHEPGNPWTTFTITVEYLPEVTREP